MTFLYIVFIVVIIGVFYLIYSYRKIKNTQIEASKDVITITKENFAQSTRGKITLVDFWANWCMPCKMMAPVLNEIAFEVKDYANVGKVDVDSEQMLAAKFNVRSIPTLILFKDGNEIKRFVGVQSKSHLIKEINNLL